MGSFQNPLLELTASAMMFIPLLSACGSGGRDSGSEPSSLSSVSISGKLAQAYVSGATIIADKKKVEVRQEIANWMLEKSEPFHPLREILAFR